MLMRNSLKTHFEIQHILTVFLPLDLYNLLTSLYCTVSKTWKIKGLIYMHSMTHSKGPIYTNTHTVSGGSDDHEGQMSLTQ